MNKYTIVAALAVLAPAASQAQLFDFEDATPTAAAFSYSGALSSVSQTVGGVTVSITRSSSAGLDITDNPTGFSLPGSWGDRSLAPFFAEDAGDFFVATFSVPVVFASIEFGDYGGDDDDTVVMEAWTGHGATGSIVDTSISSWGTASLLFDPPGSISVFSSTTAFSSITFTGGSAAFDSSLFWDNLEVEAVPEPATLSLLGLGALAALKRKKKA